MNTVYKALLLALATNFATLSYACPTCIGRLEDDARPFFMQEHDTSTAVDVVDTEETKSNPQQQRPLTKQRGQS